ncbi:TPA: hypothetical protein ACH5I5_002574, partial [Klebsiella variicola]
MHHSFSGVAGLKTRLFAGLAEERRKVNKIPLNLCGELYLEGLKQKRLKSGVQLGQAFELTAIVIRYR